MRFFRLPPTHVALLLLAGCGDSSSISTAQMDADGFTEKAAKALYCSGYAEAKQLADMHQYLERSVGMVSRRVCDASLAASFTCISVKGSPEGCPLPSPLPSQAVIDKCAEDFAAALDHVEQYIDAHNLDMPDYTNPKSDELFKTYCLNQKDGRGDLSAY
jgi:hypothetical protein